MLSSEYKIRQGKKSKTEIKEDDDLFLKYSDLENSKNVKDTLLYASKYFLRLGEFTKAKNTYQKAKFIFPSTIQAMKPIIIIDDSNVIIMKLQNYVEKLDYSEIHVYENRKDGVKGCKNYFQKTKNL